MPGGGRLVSSKVGTSADYVHPMLDVSVSRKNLVPVSRQYT